MVGERVIRDKPLKPSRKEVFGFNRLHVGFNDKFDEMVANGAKQVWADEDVWAEENEDETF